MAGVASVSRVATTHYYISRCWSGVALAAIAGDFWLRQTVSPDPVQLVGAIVFTATAARTILLLAIPYLDRTWSARIALCVVVSVVNCSFMLAVAPLNPPIFLTFLASICAALGEASNDMPVRRRYVLAVSILLSGFAVATQAWGLLLKSLIDGSASIYCLISRPAISEGPYAER